MAFIFLLLSIPLQQLTTSSVTMSHKQGYLSVPSFDGPSDSRSDTSHRSGGSQSRHASQPSGSQAPSSHPPSNAGASSQPQGYPAPLGYDPSRERKFGDDFNKNVDLPPEAYVDVSTQRFNQGFDLNADPVTRASSTVPSPAAPALAPRARRLESKSTSSVS